MQAVFFSAPQKSPGKGEKYLRTSERGMDGTVEGGKRESSGRSFFGHLSKYAVGAAKMRTLMETGVCAANPDHLLLRRNTQAA